MRAPTLTSFTALDLLLWAEDGSLQLSPKFQRRSVWSPAARSYFVDSLLRDFPVPPLHIRMAQDETRTRVVRDVVDGQQRLRAIFDFFGERYRLSRQLDSPWAGASFSDLTQEQQDQLKLYRFNVYQYDDAPDEFILEMFARMNAYAVRLNPQELRHGRYFGAFKQEVYALALAYLPWWRASHLFTENSIARMAEAEMVSELLVLQLDGLQDKKSSLDKFYSELEDDWGQSPISWRWRNRDAPAEWLSRSEAGDRFRHVTDQLVEQLGDVISETEFSRRPLYYTLYAALYHRIFGVPRYGASTPQTALQRNGWRALRAAVGELSPLLEDEQDLTELRNWQREFVVASLRQTDNLAPRKARLDILWRRAGLSDV